MAKGKIKRFVQDRGFGFITPDQGGEDLFFHIDEVNDRGYEVEEGAPVEFETKAGRKPGEMKAVRVRVLDYAAEEPVQPARSEQPAHGGQAAQLPLECVFKSFYGDDGCLHQKLFYEAPQKAADVFRRAGLKPSQFRQLYQGFLGFAAPLRDSPGKFCEARERFGAFYVERVVRQVERKYLPPSVKELIDVHRELALSEPRQMLALFRYVKNIYCYFGDSDKN